MRFYAQKANKVMKGHSRVAPIFAQQDTTNSGNLMKGENVINMFNYKKKLDMNN